MKAHTRLYIRAVTPEPSLKKNEEGLHYHCVAAHACLNIDFMHARIQKGFSELVQLFFLLLLFFF